MSYTNLDHLKKLFSGSGNKEALFKEMTLMVLARATRADLVTTGVEVETVQAHLKKMFGQDVSEAEIRVAASSELFEHAPLNSYLAATAAQLDVEQNQQIANAMVEVFRSDGKVADSEIEFFNTAVEALGLTPAQIIGLNI